jgi:phenylpropionate dioxygenase-like ring-hydroxylating dioxygenase large terminal subunit
MPPVTASLTDDLPSARGHRSIAHLRDHWYVLCTTPELRNQPLKRTLMGGPLVLFRNSDGVAGALLDRCPHRNVPLSRGRVQGMELECGYHGWRFDVTGRCTTVPGLCGDPQDRARNVPSHAVREQDGYVWVWGEPDTEPTRDPFRPKTADLTGFTVVRRTVDFEATLHATIENALDVPHTAFLHRGLFRGGRDPLEIQAVVTRSPDGAQVEYLGEPRPPGIAAKILSPSGGIVTHFDRFWMPSITEVEYNIGTENHLVTTGICTPIDDFHTRIYAHVAFKMRIPGWLVKPVLLPMVMKIFDQDAWVLKEQTLASARWGGERYTSTELDLIGPQVWRLMRRSQQGRPVEADDWRKEITLRV